ncbi:MAG TPA: histidine phosphatase family protein [Anaeromyxobacteraceae bacterium]|nr:histidine phosphatase family protein [Anaeromyxobacteraceae bacterium]
MTVYLVRHGRAEAAGPGGDAARALTPGGRAAFEALAQAIAAEARVARIRTSPCRRAAETAALLSAATGAAAEADDALSPGASSGRALLELADRLGPGTALVGHNPEVAAALAVAARREVEVPPGAIAAVERDGTIWNLAWIRRPD